MLQNNSFVLWGMFFWDFCETSKMLLNCCFTYRYIYAPMGGSQSSLLGTLFSTALTFAFVSYWHGGQSYLWYWGALNWLGVIVENGVRRILSISLIQDLIVSWISLHFMFLFLGSLLICNSWLLVWFNLDSKSWVPGKSWHSLARPPVFQVSHITEQVFCKADAEMCTVLKAASAVLE